MLFVYFFYVKMSTVKISEMSYTMFSYRQLLQKQNYKIFYDMQAKMNSVRALTSVSGAKFKKQNDFSFNSYEVALV